MRSNVSHTTAKKLNCGEKNACSHAIESLWDLDKADVTQIEVIRSAMLTVRLNVSAHSFHNNTSLRQRSIAESFRVCYYYHCSKIYLVNLLFHLNMSQAIAKPQLRGAGKRWWSMGLALALGSACTFAVWFKYQVVEKRKKHYKEFWENWDDQKEFKEMREAGIFKGFEAS